MQPPLRPHLRFARVRPGPALTADDARFDRLGNGLVGVSISHGQYMGALRDDVVSKQSTSSISRDLSLPAFPSPLVGYLLPRRY